MDQEELFQTIELIADKKLSDMGYNKVKLGIIVGKNENGYIVKVENAEIKAYAIDNNYAYTKDESVYVVIQNNVNTSIPPLIIAHTEPKKNRLVWIGDGQAGTAEGGGGGGGSAVLKNKTIHANGTYLASDDHADGYKKVVVEVEPPTLISKTITQNGEYDASSDDADGYNKVIADIQPSLLSKTFASNGTYNASDYNADGFDQVKVQVPSPVLTTKNINANGAYTPPSGVDGYNNIVVNVPTSSPPVLDTLLVTDNGQYTPPTGTDGYNNIQVNVSNHGGSGVNPNHLYVWETPTNIAPYTYTSVNLGSTIDAMLNNFMTYYTLYLQGGYGTPSKYDKDSILLPLKDKPNYGYIFKYTSNYFNVYSYYNGTKSSTAISSRQFEFNTILFGINLSGGGQILVFRESNASVYTIDQFIGYIPYNGNVIPIIKTDGTLRAWINLDTTGETSRFGLEGFMTISDDLWYSFQYYVGNKIMLSAYTAATYHYSESSYPSVDDFIFLSTIAYRTGGFRKIGSEWAEAGIYTYQLSNNQGTWLSYGGPNTSFADTASTAFRIA